MSMCNGSTMLRMKTKTHNMKKTYVIGLYQILLVFNSTHVLLYSPTVLETL